MQPTEFFATVVTLGLGFGLLFPLVRAWARRIEHRSNTPALSAAPNDPRLDRMEQALDAIAIEVERIAEAQRFQTRLLSERAAAPPLGIADPMRRSEI